MEQEPLGTEADNAPAEAKNLDGIDQDIADTRFGLDLMADGAWKIMLGLEVLRDHQDLLGNNRTQLEKAEYWIRQLNEELDNFYDSLPEVLNSGN